MSFQRLIEGLRHRVPWTVMQAILKHHGLKKGQGWDGTVKKLEKTFENRDIEERQNFFEILSNIYNEHLIAGEKSVRFFHETQEKIKQIINIFESYDIPDSLFKKNYPYLLDDNDLKNVESNVYLVNTLKLEETVLLFFCSKRHSSERIEINPNEVKSELGEFSEVFGIKEYDKQCFDIVVLDPLLSRIEIRLDIGSNVSFDERQVAFNQIQSQFKNLVTEFMTDEYQLEKPINLFPVIDKLYRSKEGRICELAFTTETASIKHEKMRRRHECLRAEAYHQGGSAAVDGNIAAYKIAATWEYQVYPTLQTQPELFLPGHSRMLSQTNTTLDNAIITNCAGINDYNFVIEKLNSFLEQNEHST